MQTTPQQYEFPGFPYPPEVRNRRSPPAPTASEICTYLTNVCRFHNILDCFQFETTVRHVTKLANGTWTIDVQKKGSEPQTESFDFVVVSTGIFSNNPKMLDIKGSDDFLRANGRIIHTSEWKSIDELRNQKVLVIGNGKSAADVALAAAKVAQEMHTAPPVQMIRRQNWYVPRCLMTLQWAHTRLVSALLPRHYEDTALHSRVVHFLGYPIKCLVWGMLEVVFLLIMRLPRKVWPKFGTMKEGALSVSVLITNEGHLAPIRRGDLDMRMGEVKELYASKQALLTTGEMVPVDLVVMGTGWNQDFSWGCLDQETVVSKLDIAEDGLWLYRNILAPNLSGIAFVGSNTLTFMHIYTSYVQAYWLVGMLTGQFTPPVNMKECVTRDQAFKRRHYTECSLRGASIEAFMQHYNDLLFLDMGLSYGEMYPGWSGWFWKWFEAVLPERMAVCCERLREAHAMDQNGTYLAASMQSPKTV